MANLCWENIPDERILSLTYRYRRADLGTRRVLTKRYVQAELAEQYRFHSALE